MPARKTTITLVALAMLLLAACASSQERWYCQFDATAADGPCGELAGRDDCGGFETEHRCPVAEKVREMLDEATGKPLPPVEELDPALAQLRNAQLKQ